MLTSSSLYFYTDRHSSSLDGVPFIHSVINRIVLFHWRTAADDTLKARSLVKKRLIHSITWVIQSWSLPAPDESGPWPPPPRPLPPRKPPRPPLKPPPPLTPMPRPSRLINCVKKTRWLPPRPLKLLPRPMPRIGLRLGSTVSWRPRNKDSFRCFAFRELSLLLNSMYACL